MTGGIEVEIYEIMKELKEKYGIMPRYTLGEIRSTTGEFIIATYIPKYNIIVFNKKVLDYFWNKNSTLTKKILRSVVYHEYYHYLRGNGYTVIANKVIKVYYPKILTSLSFLIPISLWEEINAIKFENNSGVNCKESRELIKMLLEVGMFDR